MTDFRIERDGDVAVIVWDAEGRSMNVMTRDAFAALDRLVDEALADDGVRGIVITSAKKDFAGGMDLGVLASVRDQAGEAPAQALFDFTMSGHAVLRKIERAGMDPKTNKGGKPVACALPGTAAGIGTEIALACHRRFMAEGKGKVGLPEIKVGLFPGAGGTTRYSRMVGAMAAAPVLLEGRMLDAKAAKAAQLVDEVVPADALLERAKAWVREAGDGDIVKPWDQKGWKMPGGAPYHPAGFMTFVGASAMVNHQTQGVYPAAKALLSAIYEGAQVPFDTALRVEARWFTKVLMDPTSSAMIRALFLDKQALEKGANRPKAPDQSVQRLGVLGAGMMGAGIALVAAQAGIEVVLLDQSREAAEKGKAYSQSYAEKGAKRGKTTPEAAEAMLARITPTDRVEDLAGCDLIVEAVFEDPKVKAEITARVEAVIGEDCIFATNTSTLPITGLAKASARPEQFIGIHFFSPVEKMMLVEIIKGRETGDRAVAKALDFVRQIRKTPIVVNDARFFYANRCIIPYLNEGARMVTEGVPPALVENAAKLLGFPLGPLQLIDETSIDLAVKISAATRAAMGDAYPADMAPVDDLMAWLAGEGRLGRKARAGFYAYDDAGKRTGLWPGLAERHPPAAEAELLDVQHRLLFAQVLEAVKALEEGVLTDIREGDVGAILGWGFAPWSGGPFSWLDMVGAPWAAERCDQLAAAYGERFACPALLREMAESGARFYDRFGAADAA
ncbi:fatty oxidation complex, alpha subunit [Oceanicola granulosus HTCC2516]|uniref:Fatty oxidation complex, alpha subunit n=1 Tax=Oceanicola granulosus (strain ATCC BAA-861 / DSM 15982 / KCTC 12143 / HTCC2516) TaxID=314256 RepID=Q2CE35_OCEGH|nr:3-hydroxyacyl-CoA dehydrogenase NAD-binding domain-containing protein [Oceanicola granulosus]EAR50903.1 fatty oxidation complex, alpha subunit [Oceanicola granulosus HTCC2516]